MKEYFENIGKIQYEGKESTNPLAFKYCNADEVICGKTTAEIRFIMVAYNGQRRY